MTDFRKVLYPTVPQWSDHAVKKMLDSVRLKLESGEYTRDSVIEAIRLLYGEEVAA